MKSPIAYEVFAPIRPLSGSRWVYEQRGADVFRRLDLNGRPGRTDLHNSDNSALEIARFLHDPTYNTFKIAEADELHSILCNAAHWAGKGEKALAAHCLESLSKMAAEWDRRLTGGVR